MNDLTVAELLVLLQYRLGLLIKCPTTANTQFRYTFDDLNKIVKIIEDKIKPING